MTLPYASRREWRRRWQIRITNAGHDSRVLHRIVEVIEERDGCTTGVAACGRGLDFHIPGIFSRMGRPRCKDCCRRLGIQPGDGAPFNARVDEPGCEGPA